MTDTGVSGLHARAPVEPALQGHRVRPPGGEAPKALRGGWFAQRFRQWWQARLPLRDTTTLTQRNVYILPTRPGFMLGATLLVLSSAVQMSRTSNSPSK